MTEYHVVWRIELEADDPTEAAIEARTLLQEADTGWIFEVAPFADFHRDGDKTNFEKVDLDEVDWQVSSNA